MMIPFSLDLPKKQIAIVSSLYFIAAFAILLYYGVNSGGEAFKYLLDATSIADGKNLNYNEFSYFFITYSLFLSIFVKYKISLFIVAIIQIALSYLAAFSLYRLISKAGNHNLGILIFVCYLFCYSIQKWIFFIYSEGVHTSLVVIGFCLFIKLLKKYTIKNLLFFIVISIAIVTTRPVGILFLLSAFLTCMHNCFTKKKYKTVWILLIVGIVLCTVILNSPVRYFINPDSLKRMELICMVPQTNIKANYSEFNRTGLIGAFKVVKNDIGFYNFFLAGIKKLGLFFGLIRPYYSLKNNIFLSINWLLYPFAIAGIFFNRQKEFTVMKTFSILILLVTSLGIFVTCDDWSNRFISPVFPFIIMLATLGLYNLIKIEKNINKQL